MRKQRVKYMSILFILPVLLWIGIIFYFSSQPYQEQTLIPFLSTRLSEKSVKQSLPDITIHYQTIHIRAKEEPYRFLEFLIRKSAHIFTYATLAFLAAIALLPYKEKWIWKVLIILLFVALIAMLDEWNQSASSGRMGTILDVGVDLTGACIGLAVGLLITKNISHKIKF
ncbi:VanZ family protein [Paenibacillus thermotolerans]|uniref:VanZ family protein n=1 Tax=Paenibacillus thermotolerans TaxID=3027807 RepID=UPI0023678494|nr:MULTISPECIES: VanZ family protein [unclassified Paenibacillus]